MDLIDCHTHVVSHDTSAYPLNPRDLSGEWYKAAPASVEDLAREMQAADVAQAILVQGVGAYTWDNRYAADAAATDPSLFVSACAIDVEAEDALDTLAYWVRERGVSGVRLFAISREGPSWLATDRAAPVWEAAQALGIHVIVTILPMQLGELEEALSRYPGVDVSLDHCAFALADERSRDALFELARHPGLHLKITTHNLDDARAREGGAGPMVDALVEAFGAERLMWGSDYCQTHDRPYGTLVEIAREAFAHLPTDQRAACFQGTARKLWPGLRTASAPNA